MPAIPRKASRDVGKDRQRAAGGDRPQAACPGSGPPGPQPTARSAVPERAERARA